MNKPTNLILFTKVRCRRYIDQTLGIWFWPNMKRPNTKRLHFAFPQNGNKLMNRSFGYLPVGSWSKIEFSQFEEGGTFYHKLLLNGKRFGGCQSIMTNSSPQKFENIKVYLGDPWHAPATNAKLRNVKVWSSAEKMKYGDEGKGKCNNKLQKNIFVSRYIHNCFETPLTRYFDQMLID